MKCLTYDILNRNGEKNIKIGEKKDITIEKFINLKKQHVFIYHKINVDMYMYGMRTLMLKYIYYIEIEHTYIYNIV